jgi:hypothetical protein
MDPRGEDSYRSVARRVGYDDWRGVNRLGEELLAWNYLLTEHSLPRWRPLRVDALPARGWPRSIQSVWKRAGAGAALVDVYECASRLEAHKLLLTLLAHVQSPRVARADEPEEGDVLFTEGGALRLFARANLVFFLRAGDSEPVPVHEAAARLDEDLVSKPEPRRERDLPTIQSLTMGDVEIDDDERGAQRLEVKVEDPMRRPHWYKCFSPTGELSLREGRPVYRHVRSERARLSVYAVGPGRGAARRDLEWRAR